MAKSIMIQGTMSNAGKSFITAGLCRLFREDGYRVAPFKSQNMALNSFVTREGLEMGRAQVMQAEAAGVEPSVDMNPILLKPTGETGSQVIVNGEVLGNMSAADYFACKKKLVPDILAAYHRLEERCDIIVIEGAGSPAEINLKADDIVNMGMARMAGSPVLLAGDIDRGGVFASLYGTLALLEPGERAMVKGTIINKFRGDPAILRPGLAMLEELTGTPVLGVVPYTPLELDDEDSLSERLEGSGKNGPLHIAVARLPHISNFTDFNPLEQSELVSLRYVRKPEELDRADLILLPGSKNTMDDLVWLRESGLEGCILRLAARGTPVIGICGGYQMLGECIEDPLSVERGGMLRGMGLLPVRTVFAGEKTRTRVRARICHAEHAFSDLCGLTAEGYEIHMGQTERAAGIAPFAVTEDGREDGAVCGNVAGSYLHGLFDSADITTALLGMLCARAGLNPSSAVRQNAAACREQEYQKLAALMRQSLNVSEIYRILKEGL